MLNGRLQHLVMTLCFLHLLFKHIELVLCLGFEPNQTRLLVLNNIDGRVYLSTTGRDHLGLVKPPSSVPLEIADVVSGTPAA